ncbi:HpcH/HpaI aldolase/citrate lyase family protein [Microbacterium sp. 179-I 3D3 NHS]|uniref:HpcH/HpaI aldolase/citrate lyase family protein n=1 Tax=unclassified Microbacterium TaxID=2609290 RepID=UPI0039A1FB4D
MSADRRSHRSYLYVAGSDPHRFEKARHSGADAIVLDLEDAVAPDAKASAREHVARYASAAVADETRVHVRINTIAGEVPHDDLAAAVWPGVEALRVPKAEHPDDIRRLDDAITAVEEQRGMPPGSVALTLLVESARGALAIADTAAASARVSGIAFGSSDFLADIGADGGDATATLHVRSHLVLVARAQGLLAPIDSVTTAVHDTDAVAREARSARALGFFGKSLIHPRQIPAAHDAFSPSPEELAVAQAIVAAADDALAAGAGATTFQGEFVDPAIVARHRALLARRSTP